MAGRVDMFFAPVVAAAGLVREGRVLGLAVGGEKRARCLPRCATPRKPVTPGSAYNLLGRHDGAVGRAARGSSMQLTPR